MITPKISKPVLGLFRRIVRRYFQRHFHALRMSKVESPSLALSLTSASRIIYANHSSWWDPMVSIFLASALMPKRKHYAPIDASALERYGILKRVGMFPVDLKKSRGAIQFLRTGEAIVKGGNVLWVTPQGRFVDTRERPLKFKPGLAALASRLAPCTLLPLAIEYPFWDERLPECLLQFGQPVDVNADENVDLIEKRLVEALELTMDTLKQAALRRDRTIFVTLLHGTSGAGGFYNLAQQFKAFALRRPYQAEHTMTTAVESSTASTKEGENA